MASRIGAAVSALRTTIATASGLSSGTVVIGYVMQPPSVPFVMLADLTRADAERGNTLEAYTHTWSITMVGWVSASTDSYEARLVAATDLYDEVITVIGGSRDLAAYVRDVWPSSVEVGATMDGAAPSYGFFVCALSIEIKDGVGA